MFPSALLDSERLSLWDKAAYRRQLMLGFGSLSAGDVAADLMAKTRHALAGDPFRRGAWDKAIAEEILLLDGEGVRLPADVLGLFRGVRLFGEDGPVLGDCLGRPCTVAVFPLDGSTTPGVGRVWVMQGHPFRARRDGVETIPPEYGVGFVSSHDFNGESWQLAAQLAVRVLEEMSLGSRMRSALAREWISTGTVSGSSRIGWVKLGNKLDLGAKRNWLIPLANYADASVWEGKVRSLFSVADMDSAWRVVSGTGTQRAGKGKPAPWPKADELHVLIGENLKAAIVSLLYAEPGVPVVLWHSKHSVQPAKALKIVAKRLGLGPVKPLRRLSSSDLVKAESQLRKAFLKTPPGARILFNVTSGTRVMSYAVRSEADVHPSIKLIYRDLKAPEHQFMHWDYGRKPTAVSVVSGADTPAVKRLDEESWKWLFKDKEQAKGDTVEALAEAYLSKLRFREAP